MKDCVKEKHWDDLPDDEIEVNEWSWEQSQSFPVSSILSEDNKEVTFYPAFSSGTAALRGDTAFQLNYQYYWEVKVLSMLYGTDVMIGVGTPKVDLNVNLHRYASSLGEDEESWGFSYSGRIQHKGQMQQYGLTFSKNAIVGIRLDMWRGTLEFSIDRVPQGVAFCELRKHPKLYPMLCSTAAQSRLRLVYAASCPASLLSDAARYFATPPTNDSFPKRRKMSSEKYLHWLTVAIRRHLQQRHSIDDSYCEQKAWRVPPGLRDTFRSKFFLLMPFGNSPLVRNCLDQILSSYVLELDRLTTNSAKRRKFDASCLNEDS